MSLFLNFNLNFYRRTIKARVRVQSPIIFREDVPFRGIEVSFAMNTPLNGEYENCFPADQFSSFE